jgi:hypothetical protein
MQNTIIIPIAKKAKKSKDQSSYITNEYFYENVTKYQKKVFDKNKNFSGINGL